MVFTADLPEEGAETYALLDQIRAIAAEYYGDDVVLVGNSQTYVQNGKMITPRGYCVRREESR